MDFRITLQEVIFQIMFWVFVLCLFWWGGAHVVSTEMMDTLKSLASP